MQCVYLLFISNFPQCIVPRGSEYFPGRDFPVSRVDHIDGFLGMRVHHFISGNYPLYWMSETVYKSLQILAVLKSVSKMHSNFN